MTRPWGTSGVRQSVWLVAAALCWRWVLAARTPVPAEDGVNYLWMAARFADGDFAAALSEVFQPLWPLVIAVPVALGVEPFFAGQLMGCLCGALALLPIAAAAHRVAPGTGLWAVLLLAFLPLPSRHGGEVLTEPLFLLVSGLAILEGLRERFWLLGLWAGAAFWIRPEAPVLVLGFLLGTGPRAWRVVPPFLALVAALGLWRMLCGLGFDPLPKLAFHEARDDLSDRGALLANVVAVPWQYVEAFGPAGLLVLLGLRRPWNGGVRSLLSTFVVGVAVICSFVVRRRFFVSWSAAVLPLCCRGIARLPVRARPPLFVLLTVFGLVVGARGVIRSDRIAERHVGEYLAEILPVDREVAGDMTRVIYFAGRRPLPPRHFSLEQLVTRALEPGVGAVVLRTRHPDREAAVGRLAPRFTNLLLPDELRAAASERGITVLVRR